MNPRCWCQTLTMVALALRGDPRGGPGSSEPYEGPVVGLSVWALQLARNVLAHAVRRFDDGLLIELGPTLDDRRELTESISLAMRGRIADIDHLIGDPGSELV